MRCRSPLAVFLLYAACFLSWAQESPPLSSSSTLADIETSPASEPDSSLLWQIGTETLQESLKSFEMLGPWLNKIESLTNRSLELSGKAQDISLRLEQNTSAALLASDSLERSSKRLEDVTIQIIAQLQRQQIELWIWRGATAASLIGIGYLLAR